MQGLETGLRAQSGTIQDTRLKNQENASPGCSQQARQPTLWRVQAAVSRQGRPHCGQHRIDPTAVRRASCSDAVSNWRHRSGLDLRSLQTTI